MKRTAQKITAVSVSALLAAGLLAGCGSSAASTPSATAAATADAKSQTSAAAYPIKTDKPVTLKYWMDMPADKVSPVYKNVGDTELYKELEKRTGIKIEFIHPAVGQGNDQFNLMCASRDLPDVIERNMGSGYPGGPEKAISDGIIISLNDLMDKNAPALKQVLSSNKMYDKLAKTDKGTYYTVPFIRGDESLMVFNGIMVRQDWLDELGMKAPATIDEWYQTLKTMKEKKGIEAPLSFRQSANANDIGIGQAFVGAFGVAKDFFVENGKVKYGPIEPGFRDFLATFSKWYKEKLIDPDFSTMDDKAWRAKVTSNKVFATMSYAGGGMGYFYDNMQKDNAKFQMSGVAYPTLKAGEQAKFGQRDWPLYPQVSITSTNKFPKETLRWLDYGFTQEGNMLFNFGIEGKSYTLASNYPKYTDWITKNPEGKSMSLAMTTYMRSHYNGPFVQRKEYFEQFMKYPQQIKAVAEWAKAGSDMNMPQVTFTPEESTKVANIMSAVDTYFNEMLTKFIMGLEPIENFDKYVEQIRKMKIEDAIKIRQDALERYNKR